MAILLNEYELGVLAPILSAASNRQLDSRKFTQQIFHVTGHHQIDQTATLTLVDRVSTVLGKLIISSDH